MRLKRVEIGWFSGGFGSGGHSGLLHCLLPSLAADFGERLPSGSHPGATFAPFFLAPRAFGQVFHASWFLLLLLAVASAACMLLGGPSKWPRWWQVPLVAALSELAEASALAPEGLRGGPPTRGAVAPAAACASRPVRGCKRPGKGAGRCSEELGRGEAEGGPGAGGVGLRSAARRLLGLCGACGHALHRQADAKVERQGLRGLRGL